MTKILPKGVNFSPRLLDKGREFYEYILIDIRSIKIKHKLDENDVTKKINIFFSKSRFSRFFLQRIRINILVLPKDFLVKNLYQTPIITIIIWMSGTMLFI